MNYEIKRGEIYWVDFSPTQGSEINGKRPALIIQNNIGNRYGGVIIVAAITKNLKKTFPVHVMIEASKSGLPLDSVVLLDQIRSVSRERVVGTRIGILTNEVMTQIDKALMYSLGLAT